MTEEAADRTCSPRLAAFALAACGDDESTTTAAEETTSEDTTAADSGGGGANARRRGRPDGDARLHRDRADRHRRARTRSSSTTPRRRRTTSTSRTTAGEVVGETETVTGLDDDRIGRARGRHLHLLLRHPRPPRGRHGGHARRRVGPVGQTNARPTESATQQGFSLPSTSRVKRVTCWNQPPSSSSIETISAVARTRDPAGTGAGKRTLFQP